MTKSDTHGDLSQKWLEKAGLLVEALPLYASLCGQGDCGKIWRPCDG